MGADKAFVEVGGRPMVQRVADALRTGGCSTVECQGGDGERLAALGFCAVADTVVGEGPVPAIIQIADRHSGTIVIAACDLPALDGPTVAAVAGPVDAGAIAAVAIADGPHLVMAIRGGTAAAIACREAAATSFRALLREIGAVEVAVDADIVHNVNRPDDLG